MSSASGLTIAVLVDHDITLLDHQILRLAAESDLCPTWVVATTSPAAAQALSGRPGVRVLALEPCRPLEAWQSALDAARATAPRHLLLQGPRDLVSPDYLRLSRSVLERPENDGFDVVALRSWYDYNAGAEDAGLGTLRRLMMGPALRWGSPWRGRVYRAAALERAGWRLLDAAPAGVAERRDAALPGPLNTFFAGTHDGGALLCVRREPEDALQAAWAKEAVRDEVLDFERKAAVMSSGFGLDERQLMERLWPSEP